MEGIILRILVLLLAGSAFAEQLAWVHVEGGEFKNERGESVVFRGVGCHPSPENLDRIKELGFNSIRYPLPFERRSTWEDFNRLFPEIDKAIEECKKRELYLILDAHFEPGWKTPWPQWEALFNFFEDEDLPSRWKQIWTEIASRYAHEPAIAIYELINEPEFRRGAKIKGLISECAGLIRGKDPKHIIALPQNNKCFWLLSNGRGDVWRKGPLDKSNCCYVFHAYGWPQYGEERVYGADDQYDAAKRWADKWNACLWLSEFGALAEEGFTDRINEVFVNRVIDNVNASGLSAHLWGAEWLRKEPPEWRARIIRKLAAKKTKKP